MKKGLIKLMAASMFVAISIAAFTGCSKDDNEKDANTGTIYVENLTADPYNININSGAYIFNLQSGYNKTISKCEVGYYTISVKQLSGYILYPTERTYTGTLTKGGTLNISIK